MPLLLLLDENISPVVADQIKLKRPDILVETMHVWRGSGYMGVPDSPILAAAHQDGRTLVTYDTQILSELAFWFEEGIPFAGLIFVDDATISGNDFGALVRALIYLWDEQHNVEWTNRLIFLSNPS